jgi:enoyl-CoA hydratase
MSGAPPSDVVVERPADAVALVTIDRAERMNTLSVSALEALGDAFRALSADDTIAAIVLRGAGGQVFAAGADLREVARLEPRPALEFGARGQRVFDLVEGAPQLVYAAIDGYCMGGGLDLALACDVRHASPRSVFAHPGATLGILTGFGGTARLARTVGRARALELFATGRRIDAAEALEIGLVDTVADDPVASALASARLVAERWPVATAWIKGSALRWWRGGSRS